MSHAPSDDAFGLISGRVRQFHVRTTSCKHLAACLVSPPQAVAAPVPAVQFMHNWGENAAMMRPMAPPLHTAGFAVLLLDDRCPGHSDDETFILMPRSDDFAVGLAWLKHQSIIAADRVALLGHWVGVTPALLHTARHNDVGAVVSLSAFAHPAEVMLRSAAQKQIPHGLLGRYVMQHGQRVIGVASDEIAQLETIPALRCPVLLVHGLRDRTVPVEDAYRLLATSSAARLLLVVRNRDLREAIATHAHTLVSFLHSAFELPTLTPRLLAD